MGKFEVIEAETGLMLRGEIQPHNPGCGVIKLYLQPPSIHLIRKINPMIGKRALNKVGRQPSAAIASL